MGISYLPDGLLLWLFPKFWGPIYLAGCEHDDGYARGGTEEDRVRLDIELKCKIEKAKHPRIARYFAGLCLMFGRRSFNYTDTDGGDCLIMPEDNENSKNLVLLVEDEKADGKGGSE